MTARSPDNSWIRLETNPTFKDFETLKFTDPETKKSGFYVIVKTGVESYRFIKHQFAEGEDLRTLGYKTKKAADAIAALLKQGKRNQADLRTGLLK